MAYVVEIQTAISGVTQKKVVSSGFACTPQEFLQEIATRLKVRPIDIKAIVHYTSLEAAQEIAKAHNSILLHSTHKGYVRDYGNPLGLEVFSYAANGSKWYIDARREQLLRLITDWDAFIRKEFE